MSRKALVPIQLPADPTLALEAATKQYVDQAVRQQAWKAPVSLATTANITLSGTQTIDGVSTSGTTRILVKNQTTASENGIYDPSSGGAWTRTIDADSAVELQGAIVSVMLGSTQADTAWQMTTDGAITVGTTALTWTRFGGVTEVNVSTAGPTTRLTELLWVDTDDPGPSLAWTALTLQNGWTNFGSGFNTAAYRKVGDEVQLRGLISSGTVTIGTVIAALPPGYRPLSRYLMGTATNGLAFCRIDMNTDGNLLADAGLNTGWVSLDPLRWSTI